MLRPSMVFLKFQKFGYLKNETFKESTPIGDNFTTKYHKNACDTALGSPNFELFAEEFLREVKVEI